MDLIIRDLTTNDIGRIEWSGGRRHLQYVKDALAKVPEGKSDFLCVIVDGDIVAYGGINYQISPGAGHLTMLSVREDLQGQGIGTQLISSLEARIKSRHLDAVELSVEISNNRAQALYERLGYVVTRSDKETWEEDSPSGGIQLHHADVVVMEKFFQPDFQPTRGLSK
jgi:ribosomal protein S18 acetylase RimI-like enzyme